MGRQRLDWPTIPRFLSRNLRIDSVPGSELDALSARRTTTAGTSYSTTCLEGWSGFAGVWPRRAPRGLPKADRGADAGASGAPP